MLASGCFSSRDSFREVGGLRIKIIPQTLSFTFTSIYILTPTLLHILSHTLYTTNRTAHTATSLVGKMRARLFRNYYRDIFYL